MTPALASRIWVICLPLVAVIGMGMVGTHEHGGDPTLGWVGFGPLALLSAWGLWKEKA
jgi:hypothetical protein